MSLVQQNVSVIWYQDYLVRVLYDPILLYGHFRASCTSYCTCTRIVIVVECSLHVSEHYNYTRVARQFQERRVYSVPMHVRILLIMSHVRTAVLLKKCIVFRQTWSRGSTPHWRVYQSHWGTSNAVVRKKRESWSWIKLSTYMHVHWHWSTFF